MKFHLSTLGAGALLLSLSTAGFAADGDAIVSARATIVKPVSARVDSDLDFGRIVCGTAGGSVVLSSNGSKTFTGNAWTADGGSDSSSPAIVTYSGDPLASFSLSITPATLQTVSFASSGTPAQTILVDTYTCDAGTPSTGLTGESLFGSIPMDPTGRRIVSFGATAHVLGGTPAGIYSGSFTISASYD
jgi:hypothetical protein